MKLGLFAVVGVSYGVVTNKFAAANGLSVFCPNESLLRLVV